MPSASAAPLDVLRRCARTDAGGASGRDTGEGQYPWDLMPDSIMTNATVGKVDQAPQRPVLHLTFKGTESEYTVGPDVPVLANGPGDISLLKPGVAVFVIALKHEDGKLTSARLYAEKTFTTSAAPSAFAWSQPPRSCGSKKRYSGHRAVSRRGGCRNRGMGDDSTGCRSMLDTFAVSRAALFSYLRIAARAGFETRDGKPPVTRFSIGHFPALWDPSPHPGLKG